MRIANHRSGRGGNGGLWLPGHRRSASAPAAAGDAGFTLIEILIAGVILAIGLLALAWTFTTGFATVETAQQDTIAREKAREALESVISARNNANITFGMIDNVGTGNGIFVTGLQPLYTAGPDGIIGTGDDGPGIETITLPGPDGILGDSDDVTVPLLNYQRQIVVTDNVQQNSNLKQVTVTIQYTTPPGIVRTVTLSTLVTPYV